MFTLENFIWFDSRHVSAPFLPIFCPHQQSTLSNLLQHTWQSPFVDNYSSVLTQELCSDFNQNITSQIRYYHTSTTKRKVVCLDETNLFCDVPGEGMLGVQGGILLWVNQRGGIALTLVSHRFHRASCLILYMIPPAFHVYVLHLSRHWQLCTKT